MSAGKKAFLLPSHIVLLKSPGILLGGDVPPVLPPNGWVDLDSLSVAPQELFGSTL